ncbi:hypothetical protein DFJ74DRAFT_704265 [Hyaloraphidium curvatum]|nr:hypothetical protein DFJ74DRAFT_704265 [Hyaloraphidium curvatum]
MAGGWSSLIQLGLAISLPWLLRQLASWLNRKPDAKPKASAPYGRFDEAVRWVLLATIVYNLVFAWVWTPPNLLASLQVGAGAPSFVLRNAIWEYTEQGWGQKWAKQVLGESEVEGVLPAKLERLHTLYGPLKDQGKRVSYLKYGEAAFLGCGWCENDHDYLLNIFPGIALQYVVVFFALIFATEARRKKTWWTWAAVGVVAVGLFVDVTQFASSDEDFLRDAMNPAKAGTSATWSSAYSFADRWRRTGFAAICLAVLLIDGSLERTENEIARSIVGLNQNILSHLNAYRLQRSSVLSDDTLRKAFMDFHRANAVEAELINGNPEYESVKRAAIQKHSLDKVFQEQAQIVERIISDAVSEDKEVLEYESAIKGPMGSGSVLEEDEEDELNNYPGAM